MTAGSLSACFAFVRRYHHWQLALVGASLLLFCLGSRLLALHESVSPDILTRKIQGNLELSFDRYSRMPSMLLAFAVAALLLPFLSIAAVAMRHRRTVYLYAVLAFALVGCLLGVAAFLTVQLVAADDNCAQVADCFPCDSHVQPVKCRVLSRFAMKQVRRNSPVSASVAQRVRGSALCTATHSNSCARSWPRSPTPSSSGSTSRWLSPSSTLCWPSKQLRHRPHFRCCLLLTTTTRPGSRRAGVHRLLRLQPGAAGARRRQRARGRAHSHAAVLERH